MTLGRLFFFGLAGAVAVGCGEDDIPLQVDFQYTTFCEGGGCSTVDHDELIGRNGAAIPQLAGGKIGIECEIVEGSGTRVVTSLRVQDRDINVPQPDNGFHVRNGVLALGSSMTCEENDLQLFEVNEFLGSCAGLTDGACQVLVNDYSRKNGRLVLEIDCQNLAPIAGTTRRSVRQGILTVQGCNVTEDTR
jgi:hypothetical protein